MLRHRQAQVYDEQPHQLLELEPVEIYENVQHANSTRMIEEHPQPGAHHEESPVVCEVYGKRCKTSEEFDNLIRPYMND